MTRKIYLNGEMASLFGQQYNFVGDTVQDALRCVGANNPDFKPYLMKCHEEGIGFSVTVHGTELTDINDCLLPLRIGDIVITPVAAGSKSGGAKILAAIAIAFIMFYSGGTAAGGTGFMGLGGGSTGSIFSAMTAGGAGTFSSFAAYGISMFALNLAVAGIQQLMAPDPSVDEKTEDGYMLSGSQANAIEGDPVPVLYGELRVPGTPISFEVSNGQTKLATEEVTQSGGTTSDEQAIAAAAIDPATLAEIKRQIAGIQDEFAKSYMTDNPGPNSSLMLASGWAPAWSKSQDLIITDVISEGPIRGLVNNSASVYLNDDSAVDIGHAAVSRVHTGARFTFTNNNTAVTYVPNGQDPIPYSEENRYIRCQDYKTQDSAAAAEQGEPGANGNKTIQVTTDTAFFPASGTDWIYDYNRKSHSVRVKLTSGGVIKFTGHITRIISSTVAIFTATSFSMPPDWVDGSEYKVHVDYAQKFIAQNGDSASPGNTLTLDTVFLGTSGDYRANITGTDRDIDLIQKGIGASIKFDGFSQNFLTGELTQGYLPSPTGAGLGNISVPGGVSGLAISGPNGASSDQRVFEGTSSSGFALTATQAEEADEVRILFSYGAMENTSNNGNKHNGRAFYTLELAFENNGAYGSWIVLHDWDSDTEEGNPLTHNTFSTNAISFEKIIPLRFFEASFTDFKVRLTRLSEDDKAYHDTLGEGIQDDYTSATSCSIASLNTIIKENLSYPYTALAQVKVNTKSFNSVPRRSYHCKGLLIKVPSNYVTRDESNNGIANYRRIDEDTIHATQYQDWDGSFRTTPVYTNNPAWIFYDIITNSRYGLGSWLDGTDIDKYALYRIARYCDEEVSDGSVSGTEPRFTTNVYFRKATDAYKVLKDLATVFRGMLYWLDGNIFPIMDEPKDPVYNFTSGNIIGGEFSYESTGSKTRANQCIVTWINPAQEYKQEALIVEDKENIIETGRIISEKATAFGAITEGQALRYGRWKVWTAKNQTEIASFKTSIGAAFLAPGDIVNIQDANRGSSQLQYSGRISSATTPTTTIIPLDREVTLISTSTYELSVLIEKPGIFLTQNDAATIEGVIYNKGELILGTYTEEQSLNIIQTDISSNPILAGGLEQPVSTTWQPHTRVETKAVHATQPSADSITLATGAAFSEAPNSQTIWALKEVNAAGVEVSGSKKPYKILSIAEGNNEYSISAVEHYNDKFSEIEGDFVHSSEESVLRSVSSDEVIPAPSSFYASVRNINDIGEIKDDIVLFWDAPTVTDGSIYPHILHYQIEAQGFSFNVPANSTSFTGLDIPKGTYTIGIRTVANNLRKSESVTLIVTVGDTFSNPAPRFAGMVIGGKLSRNIVLVATTSPTVATFKILNADYRFSSAGSPLTITKRSGGAVTTYQQECAGVSSFNYASLTSAYAEQLQSHFIFFDASDTTDTLKLIKYCVDSSLGLNYFYDTGTGADAPTTNFNVAGTGTIALAAASIKVIGTSTAFNTDYNVGDIVKFSSTQAAHIAHIASDTDMRLDKSFSTAIAAGASHYPQKFKFDVNDDAIIANIRNNNGTFEMTESVTIDLDWNDNPRVVVLSALPTLLSFDGEDPPVLKAGQDNTITLKAEAAGFTAPKFKITGAGFGHTDISQSAETVFSAPTTSPRIYEKALSAITTHSNTNLVFTVDVKEAENDLNQVTTTITIPFIKDGEEGGLDAITVLLSRPSVSISALHTGVVTEDGYDNSGTQIKVWEGNVARAYDGTGTADGTWTISASGTNITPSSSFTDSGDYVTVGDHASMTDDTAVVTYTITGKRSNGSALPVTTVEQHLVKTLYGEGVTGSDGKRTVMGYLYYRKSYANGTTAPAAPAGREYTFSSREVSGTGITSGTGADSWHNDPIPQLAGSSDTWWILQYSGIEPTVASTEFDITYDTVTSHISFDGVVTFTDSTHISDGTTTREIPTSYFVEADVQAALDLNTTTIIGNRITTGTISGARISLANVAEANRATDASDLAGKMGGFNLSATEIEGAQGTRIRVGKTSPSSTTAGYWLGAPNNSDSHQFHIGNATDSLYWDGTDLTVTGDINATSGSFAGTITSGATNQANTYAGSGSDLVSMGQSTTWEGYNIVLLAEDNGGADDAAIVGIGQKIGVGGQGANAGGYFQSENGHWVNCGTSSYGVYCDSLQVNTASYPNAPGTTSQYLRGDGTWQSVSGGSGDITSVVAGTGLSGGATTGDATVNLANTAVSAGTYGSETLSVQITIDAQGRITGATNKTISGGGGGSNYYLSNITNSGNTYTWVMSGTTDRSIAFGANAFTSTTIPTNNNQLTNGAGYTANVGDITGVTAGTGMSGGGTSGTVTLSCTIDTPTEVGLGNLSSSGNNLAGSFTATGNVTAYSDLRLKSNVNTIENGLDKVSKMRGVTYTKDFEPGSGVIAQELEKIAPELVQDGEYKSVAYGNLVGYLIEAIKELKDKVEELENGNSSK